MNSNQLVQTLEQHKQDSILPHKGTYFAQGGLTCVCPTTGIAIAFDLPDIKGMYMEYTNPLSIYKNVVELSKLPYKVYWSKYRMDIVAGCFLTVASHRNLVSDKLSAAHRNILLQECPHFLLVEAIRFIVDLTERECNGLAKMSFEIGLDFKRKEQVAFHTITDWLKESKASIYPTAADKGTATELDNSREYAIKLLNSKIADKKTGTIPYKVILKENRDNIKILIAEGIEDSIFKTQLIPLLKLLTHSDNLANLDTNYRAKYTKALVKIDHDIARDIVKIINHKVYSSATKELEDRIKDIKTGAIGIANEITESSLHLPSKPMTISEILAAKRAELTNVVHNNVEVL